MLSDGPGKLDNWEPLKILFSGQLYPSDFRRRKACRYFIFKTNSVFQKAWKTELSHQKYFFSSYLFRSFS